MSRESANSSAGRADFSRGREPLGDRAVINIGCIAGPLIGSVVLTATNSWVVLWLVMAAAQAVGLVALTRATVVGDAALPQDPR